MTRYFIIIVLLSTTLFVEGQEFYGVKLGGDRDKTISEFKSKGFTFNEIKNGVASGKGVVSSVSVEFLIFYDTVYNLVWKYAVYLPKQDDWFSLKKQYKEYLNKFKEKYGEPDRSELSFMLPYVDGSGNEMTGVKNNKCFFLAAWNKEDVGIQISKFAQIQMIYGSWENSSVQLKTADYPKVTISKNEQNETRTLKLEAVVVSNGGLKVIKQGFYIANRSSPIYKIDTLYSPVVTSPDENGEPDTYIINVRGLKDETEYEVTAFVETRKGRAVSDKILLKTIFPFKVGEEYQGGIIAFFLEPGEKGFDSLKTHGVVIGNPLSNSFSWSNNGDTSVIKESSSKIGFGKSNTDLIVKIEGAGNYAASACRELSVDGFAALKVWYLPSINELIAIRESLYQKRLHDQRFESVADKFSGLFWSSTEYDSKNAVVLYFVNSNDENQEQTKPAKMEKLKKAGVIPIRYF